MSKFLRLAFRIAIAISVAFAVTLLLSRSLQDAPGRTNKSKPAEPFANELDQRLQSAATAALGEREGAIVVLDPQTGRLRAVVAPKLAFQQAFPPGSTIKPFTAIAALRNDIIEPNTRISCREHKRKDVVDTCAHPLRDDQGQIVDAYFSASCGGMTANIKALWGVDAPAHLRGVRDDYCNSGSYRWTDVVPADKLIGALRSDPRTDVGQRIRNLSITKYDASGRAELISIAGDRPRAISGWEFKLIAGRSLGWNVLKSSRFKVFRVGSRLVFRGSGFGHGLGLCQEGSHVMAQRGRSSQQILAHYYPGTSVRGISNEPMTQRSANFRLVYPQTVERRDAEYVIKLLETNRNELLHRVASAGIEVNLPKLDVIFNETTGDFVGRTGMPPWAAAATHKSKIELQPLKLLKQRRILETTLRHELVHVLIDAIGGGQTPRWFSEGLALFLAGEGRLLESNRQPGAMSVAMVEQALTAPKSAGEMKSAYAAAYNLVKELIRAEGEKKVWKRVADRRYS